MRVPLGNWVLSLVVLSGCFNLDVPTPPGVGAPGLVSGRLVWQRPGRLQLEPARGASVFVLGTNLAASSDADGRFLLEGLISSEGSLFIRFDGDGDGQPERQRSFPLKDIGAGRGRQISLGDVSLGQSAAVSGRVLLADVGDANSHLGTPVFVPGFPLAAITQADGTFLLEGLAEGSVQLAAVRGGYQAFLSGPLSLRGGEELSLARVSLVRETQPPTGVLRGKVIGADGNPLSGVRVTTSGNRMVTTDAAGQWRFQGLPVDRYDVLFFAAGRLPAALYNVLVAGTDEAVALDVVLAEGQAPATTPSLVEEVAMERDAGGLDGFDGGTRTDAGVDGGGGFDGGYVVSIVSPMTPLLLAVGGPVVSLDSSIVPAPDGSVVTYGWTASPAGVVTIGAPGPSVGVSPAAAGSFRIDLQVTIDGVPFVAPFLSGTVAAPAPELSITDAGVTAISLWLEAEGPYVTPFGGSVTASDGGPVPSSFAYNGVTGRLVAKFHVPQPSDRLTLSIPTLQLLDGGLRQVAPRAFQTPALVFGPAVVLLDGGQADFAPGVTYTPQGIVAVGQWNDGDACSACFVAISPRGEECRIPVGLAAPVPWRRANAAGFAVQGWFFDGSSYMRSPMGTWDAGVTPPGAVFSDGPQLRAVSAAGMSLEISNFNGSWSPGESFGSFTDGVSLLRSSVVTMPNGPSFALVIQDSGKVQVWTKPVGGSWQQVTATFPGMVSGIGDGRIAATTAGLVIFLSGATGGQKVFRLPTGGGVWSQVPFPSTAYDVVGRGATAYLVSSEATMGLLEVWAIDPVSGTMTAVGVPVSGVVSSAELAVGDFGELGVAWSEGYMGFYDLLISEIK